MEGAEDGVEHDPHQGYQDGRVVVLDHDVGAAGLNVILRELLLTAGALEPGGEEAQRHIHHEDGPGDDEQQGPLFHKGGEGDLPIQAEEDILDNQQQEQDRSIDQPHIVHDAHHREPLLGGLPGFGSHALQSTPFTLFRIHD